MKKDKCCLVGRFPTFAILLLVAAVLWLLTELGVITISLPWIPIILIIIALGWIVNHYSMQKA